MKTIFLILFAFVTLSQKTAGQEQAKPGDDLSGLQLTGMVNYKDKFLNLSSYRGKFVILDLWDTHCMSCILSWPKLTNMQNEFDTSLQIITINPFEPQTEIRNIFSNRQRLTGVNMNIPTSCYDTNLLKLFPVQTVPFIVWIDTSGKILYMTDGEMLNEKNVREFVQNKQINTMLAYIGNEHKIHVDYEKPLFISGNGGSPSQVLYQSVLTQGKDSLTDGQYLRSDKLGNYASCINCSLIMLYRLAYSNRRQYSMDNIITVLLPSRVMLAVSDSIKDAEITNKEKKYNYSLVIPVKDEAILQQYMQSDLQRFFDFNVHWEKRTKMCFVLYSSDSNRIKWKGGEYKDLMDVGMVDINKVPVRQFVEDMEMIAPFLNIGSYPLIDETGYTGNLGDIKFEADLNNPAKFDTALQKYGMRLRLEERMIDILIISDIQIKGD